MTPRSRRPLVALASTSLAITLLAGCGAVLDTDTDTDTDIARADTPRASRLARPTETEGGASPVADPVLSPSESERAADARPTRSATTRTTRTTLPARLLTADELPGLHPGVRWTEGPTSLREPETLAGSCHRYAMLSVGALRVAHRYYRPAGAGSDARANQLVATFADAKTAWRAFEVLKSWQADCAEALATHDHHDVGALQRVAVGAGEAHWYRLSYGPVEAGTATDYLALEGLALVDNHVAVLRMTTVGENHGASTGKGPMVAALRVAAAKLR